jgi:hypothetical protein
MPIIRTIPASNFTILNNAIANDTTVSATATAALLYLISKPPHWKFNAYDLKRRLNVGLNKVYRVMRELIRAGYATYQRIQSGTIWNIYDTPQNIETAIPPVESHRVNFEHIQNECVLEITETAVKIEKPLPEEIIRGSESVQGSENIQNVVVDDSKLIFPVQLTPVQKKATKHVIKKIQQPELRQPVLFALAYYMAQNKVKSPVAYLNGLVKRANNGTFEAIQADTATKSDTKQIDITQEKIKAYKQLKISAPDVAKVGIAGMFAAIRGA